MPPVTRLEEQFEQRLKDRGLRVTRERRAIFAHAFQHFGHFRAADLFASLRQHGFRVSRATVYRTIGNLVETGLLRRHDLGDRRTLYEPAFGREHHEHLVCVSCGRMIEFVEPRIESLQDEVCHQHGFHALSHTLQIQGVCEDCRRAESRPGRPSAKREAHG